MARKGALLGCDAGFDTHCEHNRAWHSTALALPKLIFSFLHLPSLSSGLREAELLHLSGRAWQRAVKGCYQPQGSGFTPASTTLQAPRVFPRTGAWDGAGTACVCWNSLPFLCPASLGRKANLGTWGGPKMGMIQGLPKLWRVGSVLGEVCIVHSGLAVGTWLGQGSEGCTGAMEGAG